MVAASVNVWIAKHEQSACRGTFNKARCCLEYSNTRTFSSNQRSSYIKTIFWQQLIQVVARDAAGNFWESLAYEVGILIAQVFEPGINLAASSPLFDDSLEFFVACLAHSQAETIVCENVQLFDVIDRLAGHYRMGAARVVTDHAAKSAVLVSGRVWSKCQVVALCYVAQVIENSPRLHARQPFLRVDLENFVHVFRHVHNHRDVTGLSCQARAAAA